MQENETKMIGRATTPFLEAIPPWVTHLNANIFLTIKKENKSTKLIAKFDLKNKTITTIIPYNLNTEKPNFDPNWFEFIEAAFLALIYLQR